MSVRQLAALAWRHAFTVCLILLVTTGIATSFRYVQAGYMETAVVALEPENFANVEPINVDQDFLLDSSLITTSQLLVMSLSDPQGRSQLRRAGVTGEFFVSVIYSSNADYPRYSYPDLSVSVADGSSDGTHHQLIEAMQVIALDVAKFQAHSHFAAQDRVVMYPLSYSGPISQRGSLVRTYAALMFLAFVAIFLTCRFLDRRSKAPRELAPFWHRASHRADRIAVRDLIVHRGIFSNKASSHCRMPRPGRHSARNCSDHSLGG